MTREGWHAVLSTAWNLSPFLRVCVHMRVYVAAGRRLRGSVFTVRVGQE